MAALSKFGFAPEWARFAAKSAIESFQNGYPFSLVAHPIERGRYGEIGYHADMRVLPCESEAKIPSALARVPPEERPDIYVVIDTGRLIKKMRQIEKEWQRDRKARAKKANA